jgi:hypothetical protein
MLHEVTHFHQQPSPQGAARVKLREIVVLEAPLLKQRDCERITHGEGGGGTGRRG